MNRNVKWIIIILVFLLIIYIVYRLAFKSKFIKGYAKKPGDWVACQVVDYDKDYYKGENSANVSIYFKKAEVKTRGSSTANGASLGLCADAATNMNVYTLK